MKKFWHSRFWRIALILTLIAGVVKTAEVGDLSTTDASNTARFPENMALSAVNNAARALEGLVARWARDTTDGCVAASGTNTLTVSANRTISAYYDGLTQCVRVTGANTGNVTLNVDSVGAYKVVTPNNSQLSSGDLQVDARVIVQWSEPSSAWKLIARPGTGYTDPLTTNGDLLYYNSGSTRLAIGASNQILNTNGTSPFWNNLIALFDSVFGSNPGDLIARTSTGWDVVANGTSGYVLSARTSLKPEWEAKTGTNFVWSHSTSVTGGIAVDFNPIPSGVNEIIIDLSQVSQDAANQILMLQLGDSGGVELSGYSGYGYQVVGGGAFAQNSSGFNVTDGANYDAATVWTGIIRLLRLSGNIWSYDAQAHGESTSVVWGGQGRKTLSGTLDRVRLTTSAGTATFDAMSAYILAR